MSALSVTARETITASGMTIAQYVRQHDGRWGGDACGCPEDRCVGHLHGAEERCGWLPAVLRQLGADVPDWAA